ncbi:hypothetical protein GPECTOR_5g242 [Gonium pectorale]|uniref:SCP domain-containing protein n=1 Tax=Gonium pectorale TaxID=33097 RepID=A0A150GWK0_GONPE|nr:hypothetical protein GPECTOR_5g242 [Gonium pectorale]|eukprot:KXZ54143.1 hypothetical protein GPECTOR_5g242 [Gonium pectorale]
MDTVKNVSAELPGQTSLLTRVTSAGYPVSALQAILAGGVPSARAIVSSWMCMEEQRNYMFSCSMVDTGVGSYNSYVTQVLTCLNAVREYPDVLSDAPCHAAVQASLKSPRRLPLTQNSLLTAMATAHNDVMIQNGRLLSFFPGQQPWDARYLTFGYNFAYASVALAYAFSARSVVTTLMW